MKHSAEYIDRRLRLPPLLAEAFCSSFITITAVAMAIIWRPVAAFAVGSSVATLVFLFRVWRDIRWLRRHDRLEIEPRPRFRP